MALPAKVLVGAAAFSTAVYSGFTWAKSQQQLKQVAGSSSSTTQAAAHQACHDGGCAFDRLAGVYDDIVGWEETSMFYGLLRWWLVRKAEGNVLELSAGTGRNLSHFRYSKITSLTLTDVSTSMLQQAQRKFFDQMKLQYAHPDVTCRFFLADAQHMVAGPGQQPHAVLLPQPPPSRASSQRSRSSSTSASSSASSQAAASSDSIWRFKQPGSSSSSDAGSSGSSDAGSSSSSSSPAPNTTADSLPAAGSIASSGSSMGWRWSKQPQDSTHKQSSSQATTTSSRSSSSSKSNTAGQTAGSTFAPQSFDTIVDTFGLCSCDDPVAVLRQAAQLLKPGGKLLLLEHGRGTWDIVNSMIDERAERHYRTYGCWYNRDILSILQDAGLQVDSLCRWHFGTSYVIVASPASPQQLAQPPSAAHQAAQAA